MNRSRLDRTITIIRDTPAKSSTGGRAVPSWANVSGATAIPASIYPKKQQEQDAAFAREDWVGKFECVTNVDLSAILKTGDVLKHTHTGGVALATPIYFEIRSGENFGFGRTVVFVMECTKRKVI